jgi:hypothetical protein
LRPVVESLVHQAHDRVLEWPLQHS